MTVDEFKELTMQVSRTHMKKREMALVLKYVAAERSERGDLKEAENRVNRAETLINDLVKSDLNLECLLARLEKVDLLLKMHKFAGQDKLREIAAVAKSAMELAKKLFGEKTLIYFKTMLKYATTLSKCEQTRQEGVTLFMSGLSLIREVKQTLNESDLAFNMLLFMLMESTLLENSNKDLDLSQLNQMVDKETSSNKYSHNLLKKQALVLIHQASCYDGPDLDSFTGTLVDQAAKLDRSSEIQKPSYLHIILRFFIANFKASNRNELDEAAAMSATLIKDIADYFGHDENIFSVAPRAVILESQFTQVASVDLNSFTINSPEHKAWLQQRQSLVQKTKDLEALIVKLNGEKCE